MLSSKRSERDRSLPRAHRRQSPLDFEPSDAHYTLIRSPKDLRRLTAEIARGTRSYPIVGLMLQDAHDRPVLTAQELRAIAEAETRIYLIIGDYLIRRIDRTHGARIKLGEGVVAVWWPVLQAQAAPAAHDTSRDAMLAQFARELDLSRPGVRGEIVRLEEARASLESQLAETRESYRRLEQERRTLVFDEIAQTTRADTAEQMLDEALRELQSLTDAGLDSDELQLVARMGPEDRLHRLIFREWMRLTPADRREQPLSYIFGPRFIDTVEQNADISRDRLARVCAMIACGRRHAGLEIHALRRGRGPNAEPLMRADGAKAYRARVTTSTPNTPSASRLHFWTQGSMIEFGSLGQHDDFSIPDA